MALEAIVLNYTGRDLKYKNAVGEEVVLPTEPGINVSWKEKEVGLLNGSIPIHEIQFSLDLLPPPRPNTIYLIPAESAACIVANGARSDILGVRIPKRGTRTNNKKDPVAIKELLAGSWIKRRSYFVHKED